MTGPETEPFADRPAHPYIDQFTNEWAWRFEDGFNRLAAASPNAEDFQNRLAAMWEQLRPHKPEMASAWVAFCGRKLADTLADTPVETALRIVEGVRGHATPHPFETDPVSRLRTALARTERERVTEPEPPSMGSL